MLDTGMIMVITIVIMYIAIALVSATLFTVLVSLFTAWKYWKVLLAVSWIISLLILIFLSVNNKVV